LTTIFAVQGFNRGSVALYCFQLPQACGSDGGLMMTVRAALRRASAAAILFSALAWAPPPMPNAAA
jgi:hypothetical protein